MDVLRKSPFLAFIAQTPNTSKEMSALLTTISVYQIRGVAVRGDYNPLPTHPERFEWLSELAARLIAKLLLLLLLMEDSGNQSPDEEQGV